MDANGAGDGGTGIPTNLRLLLILEEVVRMGRPVTPTDVNMRLGLPKATVHRLFSTLEAEGFLRRELDGRTHSAGPRLRRMSTHVLSSQHVRTARVAVLSAVAKEIGETCNIAVPDLDSMVYLERVETDWPIRIQLPIGTHVPLHCTASGKLFLSTLGDAHLESYLRSARLTRQTPSTITRRPALRKEIEATRERGYSQDDEEFIENMVAVAVPINDDKGRLVATLACHAPTIRLSLDEARGHVARLEQAATELTRLVTT